VDEGVGDVAVVVRVPGIGETRKATAEKVDFEREEGRHQRVPGSRDDVRVSDSFKPCSHKKARYLQPQVELLAPDKVRVGDVALHDVRLDLLILRSPAEIRSPVADLAQFREQENAFALGPGYCNHGKHSGS